jgi:hypothetical protein
MPRARPEAPSPPSLSRSVPSELHRLVCVAHHLFSVNAPAGAHPGPVPIRRAAHASWAATEEVHVDRRRRDIFAIEQMETACRANSGSPSRVGDGGARPIRGDGRFSCPRRTYCHASARLERGRGARQRCSAKLTGARVCRGGCAPRVARGAAARVTRDAPPSGTQR